MVGWLDIVIVVIVAAAFILGLIKGFIRGVVGLAAAVLGFVLAARLYGRAADMWSWLTNDARLAKFLGFLFVFFLVVIAGWIVALLLTKAMVGPLKALNHLAGGAFGILEGAVAAGALVFALLVFPADREALRQSRLAPHCYSLARGLVELIPRDLKAAFIKAYQEILGIVPQREKSHGQKI